MRRELPRSAAVGVAVFALVSVVLFGLLLARFGGPSLRLHDPERVRTSFADAHGLTAGADVLVHGVRVGRVGEVAVRGQGAAVTLELDPRGAPPLHTGASAQVGAKTPLGESFVALDPGRRSDAPLPAGAAIPGRATVQIDEALAVLDASARRDLRALLATSAEGFAEPRAAGQLSDTLSGAQRTVSALRGLGETLRGQRDDIATAVGDGRAVLRELGAHDAAIRGIVRDGRATLAAVAAEEPALEHGLAMLPRVVADAREVLAVADPLAREALPLAGDLRSAAPAVSRSLTRLRPVLADTRAVLDRAPALTAAALPTLARLGRALPPLARTANALSPALRNLVPMLGFLAPRANTIAAWFSNTADLGTNGDSAGRWARFFVGFDPATGTGQPGGAPAGNAYTPPDDAAHNRAYRSGDYPRLMPYAP